MRTVTVFARACLAVLASASAMQRYASTSVAAGKRFAVAVTLQPKPASDAR